MSLIKKSFYVIVIFAIIGCTKPYKAAPIASANLSEQLYSESGREYRAHFQAVYLTRFERIEDLQATQLSALIRQTTKFLFGPLTYRALGGIQKGEIITPHIELATITNGRVVVPYSYDAVWMIHAEKILNQQLILPLPYSANDFSQTDWLTCTDRYDEDHATLSFLWYFWDPTRPGCKHREGVDFQNVQINFDEETLQTKNTFPQYDLMNHKVNGRTQFAMTFAFGYVEDIANPKPFTDSDPGMYQFQLFYNTVRRALIPMGFQESSILQSEITFGSRKIGARFTGRLDGIETVVNVVANAGVDQMELFADSFGKKHEGFFGWFGHSRVGDGFDANNFSRLVKMNPKYSLTEDYQLIYWAGCNSYSYYTLPFFDLKAQLNPEADPNGTRHLDIISNTLPSLFAFNAANANILFQSLMRRNEKASYQSIVDQIENLALRSGYDVIVNVLGDEDNK